MLKTFLFGTAVAASVVAFNTTAQADTQKGRCAVAASVHGGKKFVVVKCDRASHPGDYIIRSEAWEHKDRKRYNALVRLAGHRFTCDITYETTTHSGMIESSRYNIDHCR